MCAKYGTVPIANNNLTEGVQDLWARLYDSYILLKCKYKNTAVDTNMSPFTQLSPGFPDIWQPDHQPRHTHHSDPCDLHWWAEPHAAGQGE